MSKTEQLQIRVTPAQKRALQRSARQAGMTVSSWVLRVALPESRDRFHRAVARISRGEPESYALAELNDLLTALGPVGLAGAVEHAPPLPASERLKNQVAAMVELAAHRCGVPAPAWTREIRPLALPFFGSSLTNLRLHLLTTAPSPFRRRNLFIDATLGDRV